MAGERSPSFCGLLCAEDEVSVTAFHGVAAGLWLRCPGSLEWERLVWKNRKRVKHLCPLFRESWSQTSQYSTFFLLVTIAKASDSQLGGCFPLLLPLRMPETPSTTVGPSCCHLHSSTVLFRALWAGMMLVQIQKTLTTVFHPVFCRLWGLWQVTKLSQCFYLHFFFFFGCTPWNAGS